ncbi:molybdopterin-guanine dinucleotide biosynthesis protein B [bacterium]|nr:MAG: molybdopterin-guanine dinucleotide biosynthesis protein B [bacterium]
MNQARIPTVAVVARSGTGKTTLIEAVIRELRSRGHRVGALKHDAHDFEIDRPGKDSARFTAAGAEVMVLASDRKVAMVRRTVVPEKLDNMVQKWFDGMDIVIVEGYKTSDLPKIEVHRPELGQPLLSRGEKHDPHLLAVASTGTPEVDVPVLDADDPAAVADFLEEVVLGTP